jgi:hypothetical protein
MERNIKQLYESMMFRLSVEMRKCEHTQTISNEHYGVTLERTPGFTILWLHEPHKRILAIYDWYTMNVFDMSDGVDGYRNGEDKHLIVDLFLRFAKDVIFVPVHEVLECRE